MNGETPLLENMVAVELCRRYGKENVFFLNAEKEMDFVIPDEKLAIQVAYSINDEPARTREIAAMKNFAVAYPDWDCILIAYDEESSVEGFRVIPVWKWLLNRGQ